VCPDGADTVIRFGTARELDPAVVEMRWQQDGYGRTEDET
jgi:hypothetical protein